MLAIATRSKLSETVCDQLISKGDNNVLGAVVQNPGASISDPGYGILLDRAAADDWLSECIARRPNMPEHYFRELVSKASDVVRQRLIAASPDQRDLIEGIVRSKQQRPGAGPGKDYRVAELAVNAQPVTEASVKEFAEQKRLDEVFVSIAKLAGLTPQEIERMLMETWSSPVAVIFKAIGFHLTSLQAIYHARLPNDAQPGTDLSRVKAEFIALRRATAERILRFYQVRKSGESAAANPV
jgi:uncharacterized protein (DUF2336 family)